MLRLKEHTKHVEDYERITNCGVYRIHILYMPKMWILSSKYSSPLVNHCLFRCNCNRLICKDTEGRK